MGLEALNILQQSPHDSQPSPCPTPEPTAVVPERTRWVPSHYTVRANTGDGRLILWNSYRGTMAVFEADASPVIKKFLNRKGFHARPEGVVKYLADLGFLIKEGTDEYRRLQLRIGRQHYRTDVMELILLASEDCNFRCTYCYEDFARGTMMPWVRGGIKRLVERRAGRLRSLNIGWFGGEPLYGFQAIEDLAPFFVDMAEKHSLTYSSHMTTNGYLLTPDVAEKLLAWQINVYQITIDGAPDDHNRSRPTRDGQATFGQILANLRALKQRPEEYRIEIRINFDRKNYPNLGTFLDLLGEELGGDPRFRLRFRGVGRWGGPNDEALDVCGSDETARIQKELAKEARLRGFNGTDDLRDVTSLGAQVCYAARPYNLIVGASGKLMKCTIDLDRHDRNVVGALSPEGDIKLDEDKFALWTEPAYERDQKCQTCVVLPTCQGIHCPLIRIETDRSPCTPLRKSAKDWMRETVEAAGG